MLPEGNETTQRISARHETCNARITVFGILQKPFRHGVFLHTVVCHAVSGIATLMIRNDTPLFSL